MTPRSSSTSRAFFVALVLIFAISVCSRGDEVSESNGDVLWIDTLDLSKMTAGSGSPRQGKSSDGNSLRLHGVTYSHGVGTHAVSRFQIALHGAATRFEAMVGLDDEKTGAGSVTFAAKVDGKKIGQTPVLHGGDMPQHLSIDLTGAQTLLLEVGDGGDGISSDHADWAGARIILAQSASAKPEAMAAPAAVIEPPRMTVPPQVAAPAIHGSRVIGATPGRPFLFLVPATGEAPLSFSATNLPGGLSLNPDTGLIAGSLSSTGRTKVTLTVRNGKGSDTSVLTISGGDRLLAQTPPMGWNSWDAFTRDVDDRKTRASADALISTGLAAHGYQYVGIDDTWEAGRDAQGNIQTNAKFPDMKGLAGHIHAEGLKFGIYSSPGPKTCGGFEGSYQHEDQDARSYAAWGVDYLKYDWCTYSTIVGKNPPLALMKKPYEVMRASLDKVERDIIFSFCQYGMGDVWTWGAQAGGNLWRTNDDLEDNWGALRSVFESENGREKYAGPGHWNDPDFLSVGYFNWGPIHPTRLTPNEQITQASIWCLIAAPLMIGGDVTRLDPFTLGLLSNDEAIDVDQDLLGKAAGRIAKDGNREVWARTLSDGSHAVGLVNLDDETTSVTVRWADLGLTGSQKVRDIWLHQSLGMVNDSYSVEVPRHGCVLLKVGP